MFPPPTQRTVGWSSEMDGPSTWALSLRLITHGRVVSSSAGGGQLTTRHGPGKARIAGTGELRRGDVSAMRGQADRDAEGDVVQPFVLSAGAARSDSGYTLVMTDLGVSGFCWPVDPVLAVAGKKMCSTSRRLHALSLSDPAADLGCALAVCDGGRGLSGRQANSLRQRGRKVDAAPDPANGCPRGSSPPGLARRR